MFGNYVYSIEVPVFSLTFSIERSGWLHTGRSLVKICVKVGYRDFMGFLSLPVQMSWPPRQLVAAKFRNRDLRSKVKFSVLLSLRAYGLRILHLLNNCSNSLLAIAELYTNDTCCLNGVHNKHCITLSCNTYSHSH